MRNLTDWKDCVIRTAQIYGRHWHRIVETCGLAVRGTVRGVEEVTKRMWSALEKLVQF